jgi:hypothetical protein
MFQTTYRIHVKGQLYGPLAEEFSHTYEIPVTSKTVLPISKEAARAIAAVDFSSISEMHVEEVTIQKRLIKFDEEFIPWAEPQTVVGEDNDAACE